MEALQARVAVLGRAMALLAAYAIVVGALSVAINVTDALDGQAQAICRLVLGLWGLGAGIMLWSGRSLGINGWQAVMVWSVLQIFYVAWDKNGSPTTQLFDIPLSFTSETTVNGEVTSFREYGINLVGVALTIWASAVRSRWEHHVQPLIQPSETIIVYEIEHRAPERAAHDLGRSGDLESARRAAVSQAARLRASGELGEVVIVEQPGGNVVTRESLA